MNEAEWNSCTDPGKMLRFVEVAASDRKLRLFIVACCRRLLSLVPGDAGMNHLKIAERYADGRASFANLAVAWEGARESAEAAHRQYNASPVRVSALFNLTWALEEDPRQNLLRYSSVNRTLLTGLQAGVITEANVVDPSIVCDIFGNPFRIPEVSHAWLTTNVVGLAQGMYEEGAFDRMPILADALEDAGCTNVGILNHCRQPGVHVRGCWVVDLLLNKE